MSKCVFCKGDTEPGLATFTVDLGKCVVVVRNVPADICTQCGEAYYSTEVTQRLYKIAQTLQENMTEVAVVNYQSVA